MSAFASPSKDQFAELNADANAVSHVLVLQYHPGDRQIAVRSIDGIVTNQALIVPVPLVHAAAYYAGYVILASIAAYYKNAELLSVISLAGIPILAVVTIRDLSRLIQGGS